MKQQLKTVDYKWLTEPTGDPFADAGGYVLKEFMERYPDDDVLELIKKATDIYVNRWSAGINAFFLNSKITQPAFKMKQKIDETEKYFREVVEDKCSVGEGYCRISGQKTTLFVAGRDNSILSGSGTFINFHHGFEGGLLVSKEMLIRFHFIPLACVLVQGRIALIHSNDNRLSEFFARENCCENLRAIGMNSSEGMLKSEYRSPVTAIFRFIEKALNKSQRQNSLINYSLTLYHFTNFGASPEVKIYQVPAMLFAFYAFTQKGEVKDDWNRFVAHFYRSTEYKKAKYNEATGSFDFEKKGEIGSVGKEDFQNWMNIIYENLLNKKSILSYIRNWSETNRFSLEIVKTYLINIRNMKKETCQKIVELADCIIENVDEHKIGKYIQQIKNVKTSSALSHFVVKIIEQNYKLNKSLLITAEEFCEYLFPEEVYWDDVRSVLLIAIYQKLHEKNVRLEVEGDDDMENDDINQ